MHTTVTPIPPEAALGPDGAPEWEAAIAAGIKVWTRPSSTGDRRKVIDVFNAMLLASPPPQAGELREALAESLKLQCHYVELLNVYDGGERKGFPTVEAWLERLRSHRRAAARGVGEPSLDPPRPP